MRLNYFTGNERTLEELKKSYKELAKKYHPDITGKDTNKEMAEINQEYEFLFERVKNMKYSRQQQQFYESKEDTTETPNDFINIIDKLIKIANIEILICGSWLWVKGNTYPIKETLKNLNMTYSNNKKAWYLHFDEYKKNSKRVLSMDEIIETYGANYYQAEQNQYLIA